MPYRVPQNELDDAYVLRENRNLGENKYCVYLTQCSVAKIIVEAGSEKEAEEKVKKYIDNGTDGMFFIGNKDSEMPVTKVVTTIKLGGDSSENRND